MRAQEVAYRFSLLVCGRPDDADDAMQEALLKTYRFAARIREPEAFRAWLYRTVRNACLINRRKRKTLDEIALKIAYIELNAEPAFMDEYTSSTFLPHTDLSLFPGVQKMLDECRLRRS